MRINTTDNQDTAVPCPYNYRGRDTALPCPLYLPTIRTRQCRVPTINRGRDTALPCPLYPDDATGNDIKSGFQPQAIL